jgi:HNH endonuclease
MALPDWLTDARSYVRSNPVRAFNLVWKYGGGLRGRKIPVSALPTARQTVHTLQRRLPPGSSTKRSAAMLLSQIDARIAKEHTQSEIDYRKRLKLDKEYARRDARLQELLASGVQRSRAEALSRFRDGPHSVVLTGLQRGAASSGKSSPIVQTLTATLGYSTRGASEAVERAVHISPETVAFDLSQRDAVRVKVLLEATGAKVRIELAPRRNAGEGRPSIPEVVRNEVWRRDEGRCVDCGSRENLQFDHIVPWSRGGANTARNLELRCERCNLRKGARI